MSLFRRRPAPAVDPAHVAMAGVRAAGVMPAPAAGLVRGWAPAYGGSAPNEQIGAYSGTAVTQRAGYILEVQKVQGVESVGTGTGWLQPPTQIDGQGGLTSLQGANTPGAQLQSSGSAVAGGLGPITARRMRAAVAAAQIRQSGLAAYQWAQTLSPQ